jgi:D-amino peptidase
MSPACLIRLIALVVTAMLAATPPLAAQGGRGAPPPQGAPAVQAVRDTTPPKDYFGVTEYAAARVKTEQLVKRGGFVVYLITDMEGLAGVVRNATEMSVGRGGSSPDHQRFRQELTDEVNAAIAGARAAGATQFFVVEGHGANNFRNILVEQVDPEALLLRGWPRPNVMETGINSKFNVMMVVGNHPNAGTPGIIAHSYAFSSFTINGQKLNESGISAFIGGEYGVPLAMVSGDDSYIAEMKELIGPSLETVTVKIALGGSSGAMMPLAKVHAEIRAAAMRAVERVKAGELRPLRFERPYHVKYCLRMFPQWQLDMMAKPDGIRPDSASGPRCYTYETESAEKVGTLLNEIEWSALKP